MKKIGLLGCLIIFIFTSCEVTYTTENTLIVPSTENNLESDLQLIVELLEGSYENNIEKTIAKFPNYEQENVIDFSTDITKVTGILEGAKNYSIEITQKIENDKSDSKKAVAFVEFYQSLVKKELERKGLKVE